MSRGMVAFLAGLGGGYLKAKDKAKEDERRAKDDAWQEEQRTRTRQGWQEQDALNKDLKTAGQAATVEEGAGGMVKPDTMDNRDVGLPENQASPDGGLMQGQFKVGAKAFADRGEADAAVKAHNDPNAVADRTAGVLRKHGKITEAMSMENAVLDQKAKKLGLDAAQAKFADDEFNRRLTERLGGPDWHTGAAQLFTETKVGGMDGVTVTPKVSADGKTVEFVASRGDQSKVLGSYPTGEEGRAKFMQQVARVPLESKIGWIVEAEKTKQANDQWQQTFNFNKQKEENDQQYRNRVLGYQESRERRAAQLHKIAMDENKLLPPGVKVQAATLAKQIETNNAAMAKAMAEGTFDANSPGTKRLIEQQAVLNDQYGTLMKPYTPGAGTAQQDPLGMRQPAGATPGAPAPQPPATQERKPQAQPQSAAPVAPPAPQVSMSSVASKQAPKQPTVAEAIAGPSANPALMAVAQQKAAQVEALAKQLKDAQAGVAAAAQAKGDVRAAMNQVAAARAQVTKLLEGMNEQQAAQVLAAAGI